MNAATTTSPQLPLLLRGEIPDTSTQAANATASAPAPPSPICAPPVPSTDGGSANLSEIAGLSLNGCQGAMSLGGHRMNWRTVRTPDTWPTESGERPHPECTEPLATAKGWFPQTRTGVPKRRPFAG
jgi:hypothetical protein